MPQYFTITRAFAKTKVASVILLSVLLLGGLAACSGGPTAGPTGGGGETSSGGVVNLTLWSWVTGVDKAVALFNQTHPNIHVTLDNVGGGTNEYNKLYTAIKANNEPDLAQVEYQLVPTFETTGSLVDMSKYGANAVKNQFVPWTWSQVSLGNSVYAIPQDTGPLVLYYRADLFQKYNLPVPTT